MVCVQASLSYLFRGREFTWDFYAVQDVDRLGVSIRGVKERVDGGYRFTLLLNPAEEIVLRRVSVEIPIDLGPTDRIFVNGFQSWTETKEYEQDEKIRKLIWPARVLLGQYGDYGFYRYPGKRGRFHGWTYSYITSSGLIDFFGSLSERDGYTLFEYDCSRKTVLISRDCSGLHIKELYKGLDFLFLTGTEDDVFDAYFSAYFGQKGSRPAIAELCTGWTSWYNYYRSVSLDAVTSNLEEFRKREVPIGLFQVDDGWQPAIGDWLSANDKFPGGMAAVASAVKALPGVKAGLWLAPFICEKGSVLWKEHRDWVLRDRRGKPVRAGFNPNWSGWFYALDFRNEGLREYLRQVFRTVLDEWGFDMVKLDFLYAAALLTRPDATRGQVMCEAMEFLRSACGDKMILGCGVPLAPAFGAVDYCRIGSDVAPKWEDTLLKLVGYRERVSTVNSILSTIGRRHLNGRAFLNDPDVFILRNPHQEMTVDQKMTLFRVNLALGGLVLTSDNLAEYTEEQLSTYLSAFPFNRKTVKGVEKHGGAYLIRFDAGDGQFVLIANLSGKPQDLVAQPGSFEPGTVGEVDGEGRFTLKPYESRLFTQGGPA